MQSIWYWTFALNRHHWPQSMEPFKVLHQLTMLIQATMKGMTQASNTYRWWSKVRILWPSSPHTGFPSNHCRHPSVIEKLGATPRQGMCTWSFSELVLLALSVDRWFDGGMEKKPLRVEGRAAGHQHFLELRLTSLKGFWSHIGTLSFDWNLNPISLLLSAS